MSNRPIISKDDLLICKVHNEEIKLIDLSNRPYSDATQRLFCSACAKIMDTRDDDPALDLQKVSIRASSEFSVYIVTMAPPQIEPTSTSTPTVGKFITDFASCEVEHFIVDSTASGYAPRSITYIEDLKYLVTGDMNGRVLIWDMSSKPKALYSLQEEDAIRYTVYFRADKTRYLLLGVQNEIKVYKLNGPVPKIWTRLTGHSSVNHITYSPNSQLLYSCGWDDIIRVWNVADEFKLVAEFDAEKLGIPTPMATLLHFEDDNTLAIETKKGLTLFKIDPQPSVRHFNIKGREGYGMTYLKTSKEFLIRVRNTEAWLIDRETLTKKSEKIGELVSEEYPGHKYIANEDDSQILTNANADSLLIYHRDEDILSVSLTGYLNKSNGLEVLGSTGRIVVGDEESGLLLFLKSEPKVLPDSSKPNEPTPIKARNQKSLAYPRGLAQSVEKNKEVPSVKRTANMISKTPRVKIEAVSDNEEGFVKVPEKYKPKGRPPKKKRIVQPKEGEEQKEAIEKKEPIVFRDEPRKGRSAKSMQENGPSLVESNAQDDTPSETKKKGRKKAERFIIPVETDPAFKIPTRSLMSALEKQKLLKDSSAEKSDNKSDAKESVKDVPTDPKLSDTIPKYADQSKGEIDPLPTKKPKGRPKANKISTGFIKSKEIQAIINTQTKILNGQSSVNKDSIPKSTDQDAIDTKEVAPKKRGRQKRVSAVTIEEVSSDESKPEKDLPKETKRRGRKKRVDSTEVTKEAAEPQEDIDDIPEPGAEDDEEEFKTENKSRRGRGRGRGRGRAKGTGREVNKETEKEKEEEIFIDSEAKINGEDTDKEKRSNVGGKSNKDISGAVRKSDRQKRPRDYVYTENDEYEDEYALEKILAVQTEDKKPEAKKKGRPSRNPAETKVDEEPPKTTEIELVHQDLENNFKKRGRPRVKPLPNVDEEEAKAQKEGDDAVSSEKSEEKDESDQKESNRMTDDVLGIAKFYLMQMKTKHNLEK